MLQVVDAQLDGQAAAVRHKLHHLQLHHAKALLERCAAARLANLLALDRQRLA
jgi:hypothetical protein